MAVQNNLGVADLPLVAAADLSAAQYRLVTPAGALAGSTDAIAGVLQNKPKAGEAAAVRVVGTSKVVAGGSITAGAYVGSNAQGYGVAVTTDGRNVVGVALQTVAGSGNVFEVLLRPSRY